MTPVPASTQRHFSHTPTPRDYRPGGSINVGDFERFLSVLGGAGLALYGLSRRGPGGILAAVAGGSLVFRGVTGHCALLSRLGISTAGPHGPSTSVPAGRGFKVEESVVIDRPAEELYRHWRQLANLPHIMRHLEHVEDQGGRRSHWVACGPMGKRVEWDAEIITDRPGEVISWGSLPGSEVDNAGSVHFTPLGDGRRTEVRVVLKYDPPAGCLGAGVARLFGEEPGQQIAADLRRFKQQMEAGAAAAR